MPGRAAWWAMRSSRSIDARLAIAALKSAIRDRYPPKGCIYHSNRRSQYVSGDHAGRDDHAARAVALRKVASVEVTELCLYSATGAVGGAIACGSPPTNCHSWTDDPDPDGHHASNLAENRKE